MRLKALKGIGTFPKSAQMPFFLSRLLFQTFCPCRLSEMSFSSFVSFFPPDMTRSLPQQIFAEHVLFIGPCTRPGDSGAGPALEDSRAPPVRCVLLSTPTSSSQDR